jgi:hypothetical protein
MIVFLCILNKKYLLEYLDKSKKTIILIQTQMIV